jgi:predicted membrane-bound mannosyltransferase
VEGLSAAPLSPGLRPLRHRFEDDALTFAVLRLFVTRLCSVQRYGEQGLHAVAIAMHICIRFYTSFDNVKLLSASQLRSSFRASEFKIIAGDQPAGRSMPK